MKFSRQVAENAKCLTSFGYFVDSYCKIVDTQAGEIFPFRLWPEQRQVARLIQTSNKIIVLKARQLGLTWFGASRLLHRAIFFPNTQGLAFSYRDTEAKVLLERIKAMHDNLPLWMQMNPIHNTHELKFANGSKIGAFPTTAGDSYTASTVLIDEAAIIPKLNKLLRSVKPTVDNGGQLLLVSRANKDDPEGTFAKIYKGAKEGSNSWTPAFLGWDAHPKRNQEWYDEQKRDILSRTGALDDLYEQYPATDIEALQARELSKRVPGSWLNQVFEDLPVNLDCAYAPGILVWEPPKSGTRYVIGVDVAEGKETSDDSAAVVLDSEGNQVAELSGRIDIATFSEYLYDIAKAYNNARILVERNNHGHAVILRLKEMHARLIRGRDRNYGHISDSRGKAEMYSVAAECCRDSQTKVRSTAALHQLLSIERRTLRAPEGMRDDIADAYAIALVANRLSPNTVPVIGVF